MVDFDEKGPVVPESRGTAVSPAGKKSAAQFAAVRERGMLNAGLDTLAARFEEQNPGRKARWEYYKPNSDNGEDQVVMREGMGWVLANYSDLGDKTESAPRAGLIRRGDLVLMHTDLETHEAYARQDADAAHADLQAPKAAFDDALEKNKVKLSDGSTDQAKGFGQIKVREEIHSVQPDKES